VRFAPDWLLPGGSQAAFDELISSTIGKGRQSNKWGYVTAIQWGIISATVQSVAGGVGFAMKQAGDAASWGVFWGANLGLWTAIFTAVGMVTVKKANASKEIAIAALPNPPAPASPTVTTKTVKIEKTSSESGPTPPEE